MLQNKISDCYLPHLLDLSAVLTTSKQADVLQIVDWAVKYDCLAVFCLSGFLPLLYEERSKRNGHFLIGGTVGYPSGQTSTAMKVDEARRLLELNVDEVDMVMNVGYLLSGRNDEVVDDIRAVKQCIGDIPLKVIIETPVLGGDDICRAAELVVRGEAQWIKTATGWMKSGTTLEHLRLIRETVGEHINLKVAGGISSLATIREMLAYKVGRFGIGRKAKAILEEFIQNENAASDIPWGSCQTS